MTHRDVWLQTMEEADRFAGSNPTEASKLTWGWLRSDPCFGSLWLFSMICAEPDPRIRERRQRLINEHWEKCQKCRVNVLSTAETAETPFQRAMYREVVARFDMDLLKQS